MQNQTYIPAGQFKAQCLKIMDEVEGTGKEVIITKWGKPVAKLVSVESESPRDLFGFMAHTVRIKGDIFSTDETWFSDEE
jgi:prevent-host-death family protein